MASDAAPTFAYTVVYVNDVGRSTEFYSKAFGHKVRRLDECGRWGELESGQTTIAFTPIHQFETDKRSGEVLSLPASGHLRGAVEVCFDYSDVDAAYRRAVENGAFPLSEPVDEKWGQRVGYVRDMDGNVVRLGSHVSEPTKEKT